MARVEKVEEIMRQLGISGEVSFIQTRDRCLIVPVDEPGQEITLTLNPQRNTALIEERSTGLWDAMDYLHQSPGPHLANIRGNWVYTRIWKRTVDAVVYLLLFIPPPEGTNLEKARNLMRQLDISGGVSWSEGQFKPGQIDFQAVKPGQFFQVHADLVTSQATVQIAQTNAWGIMHMLHTFSGVRREAPRQKRNWVLTGIWTFSMDALALGLIFMVLSSYYMWYGFKRNQRRLGWITLSTAYLLCGFFVVGLKWLFS